MPPWRLKYPFQEKLEEMIQEIDEDGNGEIEFDGSVLVF